MTEPEPIYQTIEKDENGRHVNDLYPTEAAVTRALLDRVPNIGGWVAEVCAGPGLMAFQLVARPDPAVVSVTTNDIDPRWKTYYVSNAAMPDAAVWQYKYDWTITNPPFSQAMDILRLAWDHSRIGVAFLLRLTFLEPTGKRSGCRGEWLLEHKDQMSNLIPFSQPRPSFTGDGNTDSVTTAWMVWQKNWSWRRLGVESPFDFVMNWRT